MASDQEGVNVASKQKGVNVAAKRIRNDLEDLENNHRDTFSLALDDTGNNSSRRVTMRGPRGSPYEGGNFELIIDFPPDYPHKPPQVAFRTKIFHPNINRHGSIGIGILKDYNWRPAIMISQVLMTIHDILREPMPDDPLEEKIANMYNTDRGQYETVARDWTQKYAMGPVTNEAILKELEGLESSPSYGSAGLVDDDIFHWRASIWGLEGTPYAGGEFKVDIYFPLQYPVEPPKVVFSTKIFHPNIDWDGSIIGLDILKDRWRAKLTISQVLNSICELLKKPNLKGLSVPESTEMYKNDPSEYNKTAQSWTKKYAMGR